MCRAGGSQASALTWATARIRREIAVAYTRLQEDPDAWAGYVTEFDEWDAVTADDADHG